MTSGLAVVPGPRDLLRLLLPRSRSPPHLPLCLHGRGHQTGGQDQPQAREVNNANGTTDSGMLQIMHRTVRVIPISTFLRKSYSAGCQVVLLYSLTSELFLFVPSHGGSFC